MKKSLFVLFLVVMTAVSAWGADCSGTVTSLFDLSAQDAGKEVKLWVPYPVSDAHQSVTGIKVTGDYAESAVYTDPVNGNAMLYARWNKGVHSRKLTFSFHVTRHEVERRDFPKTEAAWDPADYARYLAPSSLVPVTGEVKKLADRITAGKTGVLDKAKAIYDWTCVNMYRDPNTIGCGKGDVCQLLKQPGGKCTDISSVFVALCRAAGVPAREVFGIRLGKKEVQDITAWQHCWSEFYLPGYGWVPADPADVRKMMLVQKLSLDDPKTVAYRKFFWGGIDQYRVKLAVGRDIVLNPRQAGAPLNTFGYPYAEVDGAPLDWYLPKQFVYTITYHE